MKPILRKAKKGDLFAIAKIYKEEFSRAPYNESWTSKKAIKKIKFFYDYYDIYVVLFNKKIVGFIVLNPTFMCPGEVVFGEEMAIKKEFQSKGIGTFVLNKIFRIYRKKGFKRFIGIVNKKSKMFKLFKKLNIKRSNIDALMDKRLR